VSVSAGGPDRTYAGRASSDGSFGLKTKRHQPLEQSVARLEEISRLGASLSAGARPGDTWTIRLDDPVPGGVITLPLTVKVASNAGTTLQLVAEGEGRGTLAPPPPGGPGAGADGTGGPDGQGEPPGGGPGGMGGQGGPPAGGPGGMGGPSGGGPGRMGGPPGGGPSGGPDGMSGPGGPGRPPGGNVGVTLAANITVRFVNGKLVEAHGTERATPLRGALPPIEGEWSLTAQT
jgi:hypothetical protein